MLRKGMMAVLLVLCVSGCKDKRDADMCMKGDAAAATGGEAVVAACTRAIASGGGKRELAGLYRQRAAFVQAAGRAKDALSDLDKSIELWPKDAVAYAARGVARGMNGDQDAALQDFEHAVELDPDSYPGHMNRARILADRGKFADALVSYDRAVSLSSGDAVTYDGRCWVRAALGKDLQEALADCDRAIKLLPQAVNPLASRGLVNYRLNRYPHAVADCTGAIEKAPETASSYYVRGLARRAMGDAEGGDADVRKAVELEPGIVARYAGYGVGETGQ